MRFVNLFALDTSSMFPGETSVHPDPTTGQGETGFTTGPTTNIVDLEGSGEAATTNAETAEKAAPIIGQGEST
jgi:hypothetical protein